MANAEIGSGTGKADPQVLPEPLLTMVSEIPWLATAQGRLTWIHPAAKNLYGRSAEDLISNPNMRREAIHPGDRARVLRQLQDLASKRTADYEFRVVDAAKQVHRVHETVLYQANDPDEASIHGLTRIITDRHNLQAAIRDTEAVYLSLVESLPLSVLRKDAKSRIEYANAQACEQIGKPIEELIGKTDFDLFPADLAKKYMSDDRNVMQSGKLHHYVERLQSADGKQIHVEVWKAPVNSARGETVGIQVMFWDVSDQKHAEHQIEFEKFLLSTLLETVPDSVYFKDADSRFIRLSRSCARKFGLDDPREAIGRSDADFFSMEHARKALDDERRIMESGEAVLGKIEHETYEGGKETWCSTTKVPLRDKSGNVMGTIGISRDVTEQKRAEQALAAERDLLKTIIDNVPDLIYVKDRAGRFITANAALLRLLQLNSADELLGKTDYDFSPPELACDYVADDQVVMRNRKPLLDREESHQTEDGSTICLLTTKVPLFNNAGEVTGVVGIGHDITARKRANEQILAAKEIADKANLAKSDFLANMSHEIRTPMNAIIGMTDLVLDTKLDPTQRNFLSMVQESGESLLAVINDILDFSKIEAGKLDLDEQVFDVRETLGDTMKTLGLKAHSKGLELAFRVEPSVPRFVVGDVGRLRQVIVNLVGNAVKFTDRGEVVVEVTDLPSTADDVLLHVRVRDTGIGIPEDKCNTIFDEFQQADASTTRRFGGTGLGLAISSRLVRLMGGEITVASVVDSGSEFTFEAHLRRAPEGVEERNSRGVVVVGGTRVLVVDDNQTNRMILNEILSNWGMVPTLADAGESALGELQKAKDDGEPFGLVISDVNMPEMSGYDFIEKLRGDLDFADTQVIILTSGARTGERLLGDQLGVAERLMKPVKQSELFDAIVRALGVTAAEDVETYTAEDERLDLRTLRVLLAEDNIINQKLAIGVLTRYGHEVTVASNGVEAVEALEREPFDIVLMDVQMPEMDGIEATRAIREKELETGKHIPIIAMTAHAMKGDREKCLAAGMDEYVGKPIRINMLRQKIAAVIGASDMVEPVVDASVYDCEPDDCKLDDCKPDDCKPDDCKPDDSKMETKPNVDADAGFDTEAWLGAEPGLEDRSDSDAIDGGAIDWEHAHTTVGGDAKLLRQLLSVYLGESTTLLGEIRQSIEAEDRPTLKRAAHTLKGASVSVGAIGLCEIAQRLEDTERDLTLTEAAKIFSDLEVAMQGVVAAASAHLESTS